MTGAISDCFGVMACSGFIVGVWALSWDNFSARTRTIFRVNFIGFGQCRAFFCAFIEAQRRALTGSDRLCHKAA
jgi:hypothetical protein